MSLIQRQAEDFDQRNLFLQLGLGLLSACARLDRLLEELAPDREQRAAERPPAPPAARAEAAEGGDDPAAHFVLGLIALRNRVVDVAERAGAGDAAGRGRAAPSSSSARDWRDGAASARDAGAPDEDLLR